MNDAKLEELLERIAVAVERLAATAGGLPDHGNSDIGPLTSTDSGAVEETPDAELSNPHNPILEAFLESKGIKIKELPPDDAADKVIDSLALYLGEQYAALSRILAEIKRAMQKGEIITESLKKRSQVEVSSVCQFCNRLYEVAFLESYHYVKSTRLIRAKTTTDPRAQRFFSGQWLERFVLQKVKAIHAQIAAGSGDPPPFEFLINPQIQLPNGDDFELDILGAIGASIYWIEAKSGNYQQHVSKYSKFAPFLGLDREHALMVLTDVPEDNCNNLSALHSISVCNLKSFEDRLLTVVRHDMTQQ